MEAIPKENIESRNAVVVSHARLARKMAKKYENIGNELGLELNDLIQAAYLGLMTAAEKFNPTRGTTFQSYAQWWILHEINKCLRKGRLISVSEGTRELSRAARKLGSNGEESDIHTMAERLGVSPAQLKRAMDVMHHIRPISFDAPASTEDDNRPLHDTLGKEDPEFIIAEIRAVTRSVERVLEGIPMQSPRDLAIFNKYYKNNHTLQEIATEYDISLERVRQICKTILQKVRQGLRIESAITLEELDPKPMPKAPSPTKTTPTQPEKEVDVRKMNEEEFRTMSHALAERVRARATAGA